MDGTGSLNPTSFKKFSLHFRIDHISDVCKVTAAVVSGAGRGNNGRASPAREADATLPMPLGPIPKVQQSGKRVIDNVRDLFENR